MPRRSPIVYRVELVVTHPEREQALKREALRKLYADYLQREAQKEKAA